MSKLLDNQIDDSNNSEQDKNWSRKSIFTLCFLTGGLAFGLFCFFVAKKYLKERKSDLEEIIAKEEQVKQKFASITANLTEIQRKTELLDSEFDPSQFNALNASLEIQLTEISNDFEFIEQILASVNNFSTKLQVFKSLCKQLLFNKNIKHLQKFCKMGKKEIFELKDVKTNSLIASNDKISNVYFFYLNIISESLKKLEHEVNNFYHLWKKE